MGRQDFAVFESLLNGRSRPLFVNHRTSLVCSREFRAQTDRFIERAGFSPGTNGVQWAGSTDMRQGFDRLAARRPSWRCATVQRRVSDCSGSKRASCVKTSANSSAAIMRWKWSMSLRSGMPARLTANSPSITSSRVAHDLSYRPKGAAARAAIERGMSGPAASDLQPGGGPVCGNAGGTRAISSADEAPPQNASGSID